MGRRTERWATSVLGVLLVTIGMARIVAAFAMRRFGTAWHMPRHDAPATTGP